MCFLTCSYRKDLCEKAAPADLGSCAYSARKKDADFDPSSDTTAIAHQKPAAEPPPSQGPTSECGYRFLLQEEGIVMLFSNVFLPVFIHDLQSALVRVAMAVMNTMTTAAFKN